MKRRSFGTRLLFLLWIMASQLVESEESSAFCFPIIMRAIDFQRLGVWFLCALCSRPFELLKNQLMIVPFRTHQPVYCTIVHFCCTQTVFKISAFGKWTSQHNATLPLQFTYQILLYLTVPTYSVVIGNRLTQLWDKKLNLLFNSVFRFQS